MTALIVTDTTALIVLGKQQRLDLLGDCFERVLLPPAVYAEWLAGDAAMAAMAAEREWLEVVIPNDTALLTELRGLLDASEAEAIHELRIASWPPIGFIKPSARFRAQARSGMEGRGADS